MFQFPFGTMHQLNLDWFLQQWQQLRQDWIDEEQNIEDSMQDVYDARDAAIQAKDDAVAAKNDAESAQAGVHADALIAEGYAVGEQNGTPVGPGDPYYQSNAKFYSINAGTYRYLSEAYARGTMGGTPVDPGDAGYEDNAKYYKDAADIDASTASGAAASAAADALLTEGYAVGEQNGTPVSSGSPYYENNAKYFHQQTAQDKSDTDTLKDAANAAALRAEGYSSGTQNGTPVSSGSPYYENNAAYFYGLSAGTSGDLAQDMIASQEASAMASAAHAIGSYFIYNGILYQTTAAIDIGDTITPGSNCTQVELADKVANIESGSVYHTGTYLYNSLHTGDLPNTAMASRVIGVEKNKIHHQKTGSSTTKCIIKLIGDAQKVGGNVSYYDYVPASLDELDLIQNITGASLKVWQNVTEFSSSSQVFVCVMYYKIVEGVITYIAYSKINLGYTQSPNAYQKQILNIPNDAEYYGLYFCSGSSNTSFDAIFEIDY